MGGRAPAAGGVVKGRPWSQRARPVGFTDLVAAARHGEPWAVDAMAAEYLPRLVAFTRARGASDPEGMADVVLFSVLRRLDELDFDVAAQLWSYLCMTARSRLIDEHRKAKPVELVGDTATLDRAAARPVVDRPAGDFDDGIVDRHYVSEFLSSLTDDQREVLELRFLDDRSIEDTASLTGRTQGAVKGLQRRAISAILAAVALALIIIAVRGTGEPPTRTDRGPANPIDGPGLVDDGPEVDDRSGVDAPGPDDGLGLVDPDLVDPDLVDLDLVDDGSAAGDRALAADGATPGETAGQLGDAAETALEPSPLDRVQRWVVTTGSAGSLALDDTGAPGAEDAHGVRISCAVSHIAHVSNRPGGSDDDTTPAPATLHWGATGTGRGTCDGGLTDRSTYAMPALFDEAGQLVLPEWISVEYKSWGPAGFDRQTIQSIPAGLELVADPARFHQEGDTLRLTVSFPDCVRTGAGGHPVLSSGDRVSHLAYGSGAQTSAGGCPDSHPYRIPQLGFIVRYHIDQGSGWFLAPGPGRDSPAATAVSDWTDDGMVAVVTCVRHLLAGCGFVGPAGGATATAGLLPARFVGPSGERIYDADTHLAPEVDRTPFGTAVDPLR